MPRAINLIIRDISFFIFLMVNLQTAYPTEEKGIKLLVLITASDDLPVYEEHQKIWRSYMHLDPLHVQAFFMKADPNLSSNCKIQGDTIWCRTVDALFPGVINKTISSIEFFSLRGDEFDYVLRTNLSSFYYFPALMEFLEILPQKKCYCARRIPSGRDEKGEIFFGSGAGIILSKDLAQMLVEAKSEILASNLHDDLAIGSFFHKNNIRLLPAQYIETPSLSSWLEIKENIPEWIFHFRCRNLNPDLRISDEIYILDELLHRFYGIQRQLPEY